MGQIELLYKAFKRLQDPISNFFEAAESDIVAHTHDIQNITFAFHLPEKNISPLFVTTFLIAINDNKYYTKDRKHFPVAASPADSGTHSTGRKPGQTALKYTLRPFQWGGPREMLKALSV